LILKIWGDRTSGLDHGGKEDVRLNLTGVNAIHGNSEGHSQHPYAAWSQQCEGKKLRQPAQLDLRLLYLGILYFRLACVPSVGRWTFLLRALLVLLNRRKGEWEHRLFETLNRRSPKADFTRSPLGMMRPPIALNRLRVQLTVWFIKMRAMLPV
jgi:hypothetical protein